ncbi:MAG: diaminopimelate epimerase [Bacteroidia bacterium]|nr:diaminopimelate epimerase [Bacteroidia bacterium]
MDKIHFHKYQGTGNDFIILDGRTTDFRSILSPDKIQSICDRRFGVGADGLMILNNYPDVDFEMVYYNSDGRTSSMCGNGGRCLVAYAYRLGIINESCTFIAIDGKHHARLRDTDRVELKMIDVDKLEVGTSTCVLNTGSPHYISFEEQVNDLDIIRKARAIRYSDRFSEVGINVNFVAPDGEGIQVRTYERGVEDETFSCGTGVTAAAIAFAEATKQLGNLEIPIVTKGGKLSVKLEKTYGEARNIWLCGPATFVFEGFIEL